MVNILTGAPFDAPKRLHHRDDEGALEFPSSASSRRRGLLALKAQNWLAAKKSVPTARDYLQDGLVHMWDGIENAGWGVHDATATNWIDLVGGLSIPYSSTMAIHDKFCSVDGGGAWVKRPTGDFALVSDGWTIDGVCSTRGDTTGVRFTMSFGCDINFSRNTDNLSAFASSNNWQGVGTRAIIYKYGISYDVHTMSLSCGVATPGMTAYVDGAEIGTNANGAISGDQYSRSGYGIARDWNFNGANGDYYCFRVYKRVLTASEVAANRAVDAKRFGLV